MRRPQASSWPVALIALGVVAIVVGSLGLAYGWGTRPGGHAASAVASGGPRPAAVTPTTTAGEPPAVFLTAFVQATRTGDAGFLFDRLDPAVIERYGQPRCRDAMPHLFDPTAALTLRSAEGPTTFDYASDGKSVVVPGVYVLAVDGVLGGDPATRDYHVALVDGQFRTFFDCGDPLPGAP